MKITQQFMCGLVFRVGVLYALSPTRSDQLLVAYFLAYRI